MNPSSPPLLRMREIHKSFPGVRALTGVDLELRRGEVLALLGENGAGKSTLIKVLGGAHLPDSGEIEIDGVAVKLSTPAESQRSGVGVIYQEFNLVPGLTAAENIFLGHETTRLGLTRVGEEHRLAKELFDRLGVPVPPGARCSRLTVAQKQIVEIAKALALDARIIVMDEPSATLTPQEVGKLFAVIRELQSREIGVIYISHRLDEIFEIADRAMILRDGSQISTRSMQDFTRESLIEDMVGRRLENEFPERASSTGEERFRVSGLRRGNVVRDVSFSAYRGEILGITGLVGAGRSEMARLIFGADRRDAGTIHLDDNRLNIRGPRDAIRQGICLLSEDRKGDGLVLALPVADNFSLPNLGSLSRLTFVKHGEERKRFASYIDSLLIKTSHQGQKAKNLSGGNQQKVVLAKWLERNCEVLIFDEPTRGIDVGAKFEIYQLMHRLADAGKVIIMISSELPEVLGLSDRILVMHEGQISGEVTDVANASQEDLLRFAIGANAG
ncbi:MAG: sugar ABC transporter ATP-binding protein [Planctomycetota bacterium]